jgi:3',5'-cyclic AMP phosphodiesterase CpdA
MSFSLAHLSDLHLPPPPRETSLWRLSKKQVLAILSWHRKRHRIHTLRPLAALLGDLAAFAPDHLALTGDITNFAVPEEFRDAREWLDQRGPSSGLSVIPGNHDLTSAQPWRAGIGQWDAWSQGDQDTTQEGTDPFPFLKRRGPAAIIGLSSAVTTPVFSAAGQLGQAQRERLETLLGQARQEGLFRVVLIHHPPVMGQGGPRKALRDRAALCAILQRVGAELVLHGHHHVTRLIGLPGPDGPIPVFGVPAALATIAQPEIAGWHFHRILRTDAGWRLTTIARRYDAGSGRFRQAAEWTMNLPPRA